MDRNKIKEWLYIVITIIALIAFIGVIPLGIGVLTHSKALAIASSAGGIFIFVYKRDSISDFICKILWR